MSELGNRTVGIVGATGAVGQELLAVLAQRQYPADRLRLFASSRSAGGCQSYRGVDLPVEHVESISEAAIDACLFAADADTAKSFAPRLVERGCVVVDNSSAFRDDPQIPLVIPEVNRQLLDGAPRLVANPNCSTIILLVGLEPLRRAVGIDEIRVATYQAVSGAGAAGMADLREGAAGALRGETPQPGIFPQPSAFNVFCHESALDANSGLCGEEQKMIQETRKIWESPSFPISPVCIRVPVLRAHSQAVWIQLSREASRRELRELLSAAPGLRLVDNPSSQDYPTPLAATGNDEVLVGRIRPARFPLPHGESRFHDELPLRDWTMFLAGDQLRKGAALNAVQILECLGRKGVRNQNNRLMNESGMRTARLNVNAPRGSTPGHQLEI